MPVTAQNLVTSAFRKAGILGVGQTLSAEDMNNGFNDMNAMISQFVRRRWLIWHLIDTAFTANGQQFYTVGSGGNYNLAPRPDRIEKAYFVQTGTPQPSLPPSYDLDLLQSYEDYASISLKTLVSWPECVFYDSDFPTAKLYVWPIPTSGQYIVHILTKANLAQFATLTTQVNLPLEYIPAIEWNLVLRLRASYPRAQEDPIQADRLERLAADALNVIRMANTQIPRLRLPRELTRNRGSYNVYSDRSS